MDFACSRCGHRQSEDAACGGCGNDVVQDLRDRRGREVLRETEARLHSRRVGRYFGVGAVVGILIAPLFIYVFMRVMGDSIDQDPMAMSVWVRWKAKIVGGTLFLVWTSCCLGVVALLERTLGRRRKFPYLDEYGG
jgi:hypothetical protein